MFDGFTFVATGNFDKQLPTGHCICDHCGARVETGIMNLAEHWSKCWGKAEFEEMKSDPKRYIEKKKMEILITQSLSK